MLLRDVFVHLAHRYLCDDHVAKFLVVVYVLLEDVLVNYVVSGSLPSTMHSGDSALMRFRCLRLHFMCFVQFLGIYSAPSPIQIHGPEKWL